ncbi:MAG: 4Fe-4S dicluster domain-containing protein [Candidatus Aminicenantes bacterium]|nr:4Fe-4S dicluster domain-containing protein [Candidatus Aminicenantes bacterium]
MKALQDKARELLAGGAVQVVIGYGRGSAAAARAVFVREASAVDALVLDETCLQNLAVYLRKPEVRRLGKAALVAIPAVLRTILQLAAENQVSDGSLIALAVTPSGGEVVPLATLDAVEKHVAGLDFPRGAAEEAELRKFAEMGLQERRSFWEEQFSRCLKCYACRAACPLCYCERCTVECNQPQWIPVPAHDLGNLEWNVMRAMHLAGRCVDCGDCSRACPVGIPLQLLNRRLVDEVYERFAFRSGMAVHGENAMSTFKPDDPEDFIR